MNIFTVSLFGHRRIDDIRLLEKALAPAIRELTETKQYVSFLIGRNGEFDEYAASVIKRVQKECGTENNDITLVLPYSVADLAYYEMYYDHITVPDAVYGAHPKRAITLRNHWMIEQSDLVLVFVMRDGGGADAALKYAQKKRKKVINLYESVQKG